MKPLWVFVLCYAWAVVLIFFLWHAPTWVHVTVQPTAAESRYAWLKVAEKLIQSAGFDRQSDAMREWLEIRQQGK